MPSKDRRASRRRPRPPPESSRPSPRAETMTSLPLGAGALPSRLRALVAHIAFSGGIAAEAVVHNKLRASLTSLGILFGVASVIAMLAIGNGAEQEILAQMKLLGANNIVVTPIVEQKEGKVESDDGRKQSKKFSPGLSYLDAQAITRHHSRPSRATSGEVVVNSVITREGHHRSGKVVGVDSTLLPRDESPARRGGRIRRASTSRNAAPVAVIGQGVKSRFFTTEDPIGHTVKVGTQWLTDRRRARGPEGVEPNPRSGSASATPTWTCTCRCPRCCCGSAIGAR